MFRIEKITFNFIYENGSSSLDIKILDCENLLFYDTLNRVVFGRRIKILEQNTKLQRQGYSLQKVIRIQIL